MTKNDVLDTETVDLPDTHRGRALMPATELVGSRTRQTRRNDADVPYHLRGKEAELLALAFIC